LFEGAPGRYVVIKVPKGGGLKISTVVLGGVGPIPPPPFPPPLPPPPVIVDPSPISDPGFRVLFTFPELTRTQMGDGQKAIWFSQAIRTYMTEKCVKVNGIPEWRFWADTENPINATPTLRKMFALVKGQPGMVVISNGTTGTIQPWPENDEEALALLKKYGEQ
jgi:hypothetical protein